MNTQKHTPGTWTAKDCAHTTTKRTEIWTSEDQEEPILEIIHNEVNLSETTPNADLIAAAPELLAALRIAIEAIVEPGKELTQTNAIEDDRFLQMMEAVLKAEGKRKSEKEKLNDEINQLMGDRK